MGWLIAIPLFVVACIIHNDAAMITAGLFAIAGAISFSSIPSKDKTDNNNK